MMTKKERERKAKKKKPWLEHYKKVYISIYHIKYRKWFDFHAASKYRASFNLSQELDSFNKNIMWKVSSAQGWKGMQGRSCKPQIEPNKPLYIAYF